MTLNSEEVQSSARDKNVPWYTADFTDLQPSARALLEQYSKIPPEQVVPHILDIVCLTSPSAAIAN